MGHRPPRRRIQPGSHQRQTRSRLRANGNCQECTTISIMTKGSVPGWGKADNNSGSRSRLNDRPPPADFMMARAQRAHPKAEYTTATDPLPKVRDQSVRCLQGESIHELLDLRTIRYRRYASWKAQGFRRHRELANLGKQFGRAMEPLRAFGACLEPREVFKFEVKFALSSFRLPHWVIAVAEMNQSEHLYRLV